MTHYEIVLLIHPDQSDRVPGIVDKYRDLIEANEGKIHRLEDWGRRQLSYVIDNVHKAHYVLLNIEVSLKTLTELQTLLQFNEAILRSLVIRVDRAISDESPMVRGRDEGDQAPKRESKERVEDNEPEPLESLAE